MTTYTMTPKQSGTRLRENHNTFAAVITSYGSLDLIGGDEVWEALADGNEVKKGDKWLHVTHVNKQPVENGWMAYIHKGVAICNNFKEVTDVPSGQYPRLIGASITLRYDDGRVVTDELEVVDVVP